MDLFYKYKSMIFRLVGGLMLLGGFMAYFWMAPKEGASANELAAANVVRMEAKVAGVSGAKESAKPSSAKFVEKFQETREAQIRYMIILTMLFGTGFLLYSFLKQEKE